MIKQMVFLIFAPFICLAFAGEGDSPGASGPHDSSPSSDPNCISDWALCLTGGDDYNEYDHGNSSGGPSDYGCQWRDRPIGPNGPGESGESHSHKLVSFDDTARAALHEAPGANGPAGPIESPTVNKSI